MQVTTAKNVFLRYSKKTGVVADLWFIHGFGESGLSFSEAFSSPLARNFNLFVPDFPGLGASPYQRRFSDLPAATRLLEALIRKISGNRPIALIAHSLGGVIGTWVCRHLKNQVIGSLNIEGNLTRSDTFFSGLAAKAKDPKKFHRDFLNEIHRRAKGDVALQRYFASLRFADPRILAGWGRSGVKATGNDLSGREFEALSCRKIYYWGDQGAPQESVQFIKSHSLPNHCFKGAGHWPMIDKPKEFYESARKFLSKSF